MEVEGIRVAFEMHFSKSPFEWDFERWPDDYAFGWPSQYKDISTEQAWIAWQAGYQFAKDGK